MKNLITIIQEVYNIDRVSGVEFLTYNVRVSDELDSEFEKYSYNVWDREKAINLANKIHRDQRTSDLVWVHA